MEKSLEERVQELEDRERIRELRATYCFLVDDGRFEELVDHCFTEDARCDFHATDGSFKPFIANGREEVLRFYRIGVAGLLRDMCHMVHNDRIEIDGDQASGDCYFEGAATDNLSGNEVIGAGRYIDRYRREGGHWRFSERVADIFFMASHVEGWTKQRFIPGFGIEV
jgi:hypothetical protein